MLKGILFDFDKTLVNLADFVDWEGARKEIREFYSKSGISDVDLRNHSTTFKMMEKFGKKPQASKILEKFEMRGVKESIPMNGSLNVLEQCKSLGIKIAIVSLNSRNSISASMEKCGLLGYADFIAGRDDVENFKPHPEHVNICLAAIGIRKQEAAIVGDTAYDITAGKNAGILAIGVCTGFSTSDELKKNGADYIVNNLGELGKIIETLAKG